MKDENRTIWDRILHPSGIICFLLFAVSLVLLIYSLGTEHEKNAVDYTAYLLSTYTLVVLCLRVPPLVREIQEMVSGAAQSISTGNEAIDRWIPVLLDYEQRTMALLHVSLVYNLAYAAFKLITGVVYHSFWMGALGLYYAVLAFMRFSLVRFAQRADQRSGRDAYRRTAWRLNFLTLTMTGIFVQMTMQGRTYEYPGILIYVMAIFAFGKIISAVSNLIRRRREENLVLAASRSLTFACALMSILALQTAMISQFGADQAGFAELMNGIMGAVITALLITLSALMIARAAKWQATDDEHKAHD